MKTLHEAALELMDLKPGDKVKVLTSWPSRKSWGYDWVPSMDDSVGKEFTIEDIDREAVLLDDAFHYPAQVLEKLDKANQFFHDDWFLFVEPEHLYIEQEDISTEVPWSKMQKVFDYAKSKGYIK